MSNTKQLPPELVEKMKEVCELTYHNHLTVNTSSEQCAQIAVDYAEDLGHVPVISILETTQTGEPERGITINGSKIQPGQKLKDGDYFEGGTAEEYAEVFHLENLQPNRIGFDSKISVQQGFVSFNGDILCWSKNKKTKYSFEDFKQLCINTFGDGK